VGVLEAVVIGGGQAGLAMSRALVLAGIEHVLLERARVGESWRTQRWDSFALNTPGSLSILPGDAAGATEADGFATRDAFIAYVDGYPDRHGLPVRTGVTVASVERRPAGGFVVRTAASDPIKTRAVIVATGMQRLPRIPAFATDLPADVTQLHSSAYRNPGALPAGGVLVVGSAQSGVQIVEDLLDAGRPVWLATSRVARCPRRYRGGDSFDWLYRAGFFAQTVAALPDPAMQFAPQPVISGVGRYGHTVSLQDLAARGVRLVGHVAGADRGRLTLADDVGANVAWGDSTSADLKRLMDRGILASGVAAPDRDPKDDPADTPHADPSSIRSPETLDLAREGISTVIWTTGVRGEFDFLPGEAVGPDGRPLHENGLSPVPGLYVIGLPWLRSRASGILPGVGPDAEFLVGRMTEAFAAP
jgi:putative flavoprotein involved in K+ transport